VIPELGLVVVAARSGETQRAVEAVLRLGGTDIEQHPMGRDRVLVYGGFPDAVSARAAVIALRADGWPAVERPVAGGHLTAWRNYTRPTEVRGRVWVGFPWSEFDRDRAPAVVEIDTGRAFGTGGHPTTRLLLGELADRLTGGESVLDVGCGSGVLAVTAARLGAGSALGIDINPEALVATRFNAALNDVGATVETSDVSVHDLHGVFDVIVANIGAAVLTEFAPALQALLAPGGWLGLSGLSPAQVSKVAAAYPLMRVLSVPADEDWAAIVAVNSAPPRR
jgi:ribosomal protein L11 methyltransferase